MPDENHFTLRQVDLARSDFAAISDDLDFAHGGAHRSLDNRDRAARNDAVIALEYVASGLFR